MYTHIYIYACTVRMCTHIYIYIYCLCITMYREGRMQDGRCREMVLRKDNGGDANVSVVKGGETA